MHEDQIKAKNKRENELKAKLDLKYNSRLNNKHDNYLKLITEIENMEIIEKALLEE